MYIIQRVSRNEKLDDPSYIPNGNGYVIFAVIGDVKYVAIPVTYIEIASAVKILISLNGSKK